MEKDLLFPAELADLLNRLDDTDLVVDGHDTDEGSLGSDSSLEIFHLDEAVVLNGKICDLETLILKMATAVEDALVLSLCGDDVLLLARAAKEASDALDAHVVTLGGATCEDDLLGVGADEGGDVLSGLLNSLFTLPAVGMCSGMGVTIDADVERHHGIKDSRIDGGGSLHVKVDWALTLFHDCCLLQHL